MIATGLLMLNKALLAELTQMSQDIAALKAEVASLKPKPTGLQRSSHAFIGR
jgi:type II secretory pathway component PulM